MALLKALCWALIFIISIFNFFGPAVRIIQDEKSQVRSDAYFPEWKPAFRPP